MKRIIALFSTLLILLSLHANPVDANQARNTALRFLQSPSQTKSLTPELQLIWVDEGENLFKTSNSSEEPAFYVFGRTDGEGFVAISGDDAAYPILGYGHQSFRTDSMPSNLHTWFENYRRQIQWIRDHNILPTEEIQSAWKDLPQRYTASGNAGKILHTALWDQNTPYNNSCPMINGRKTPTGCVATSIAIVMHYHKWPDVGTGRHTYITDTHKLMLSATFNTFYTWDNMPDTYKAGTYTTEQADNVATLMYDCGILSDMDYTPSASGTSNIASAIGLINYMKYDPSLQLLQQQHYSTGEWDRMLQTEIDQDRPVIYSALTTTKEGHQFILDGYDGQGYYSVNWGWSGIGNGYYLISALNPAIQGTGGSSFGDGFNTMQQAFFGLKPIVTGSPYKDVISFGSGTTSEGKRYQGLTTSTSIIRPQEKFTVTAGFIDNYSMRAFNGTIAVSLVSGNGEIKEFISPRSEVFIKLYNSIAGDIPCIITTNISPTDRIRMFYKSSDSDKWQWIRGGGDTKGEILVSNPTPITSPENDENESSLLYSSPDEISLTTSSPIQDVTLYNLNGHILKVQQGVQACTLSFSLSEYPAGTYLLKIHTSKGTESHKVIKE